MLVLMARAITIAMSVSIARAVIIAINVSFGGQGGHNSYFSFNG